MISGKERVSIKEKEKKKLNWDDKLTLEFNGDLPRVNSLVIERVENIPTVYLCGNSTVVDQDNEPWASWGQMIPLYRSGLYSQSCGVRTVCKYIHRWKASCKDTESD